jgi:hypothetical protein
MMPRNLFTSEIYIRISGDEEFTYSTRWAGYRLWAKRFLCNERLAASSIIEEREPESSLPAGQPIRAKRHEGYRGYMR